MILGACGNSGIAGDLIPQPADVLGLILYISYMLLTDTYFKSIISIQLQIAANWYGCKLQLNTTCKHVKRDHWLTVPDKCIQFHDPGLAILDKFDPKPSDAAFFAVFRTLINADGK